MENYLAFAKKLAKDAGAIIRNNFESIHDVETKDDESPVTKIDKQINSLVIESIQREYPTHGILGEEADYGSGTEKWQWLCDPLDGTKPFILGIPQSMFIIALLEDGIVQLAVAYDPYLDKLYHAIKNGGAFCNGTPIHVSNQSLTEGYVFLDTSSFGCLHALKEAGGKFQQSAGTGHKLMLLAQGRVIGFINHTADFHDIGPTSLIIEEAGGKVTGLDGATLDFRSSFKYVVATNGKVHDQLLKIANSAN